MPKFQNILFPVDFSQLSSAASPFVLSMAQRHHAKVTLLHVVQPPPPLYPAMNTVYPESFDMDGIAASLRENLEKFAAAELPKVKVECVVLLGDPASVITEIGEQGKIDLIAMPTHGYGPFRRLLLGSVTAKVLHDSKLMVWTDAHAPEASHRAHPQPRHIVCGLDLKRGSAHVLEIAMELSGETGATLDVVHMTHEGDAPVYDAESRIEELLTVAAREHGIKIEDETGPKVDAVVDQEGVASTVRIMAIRKRADLVVIGRGAIQSGLHAFQANAYSIVRESPCPVLSV